MADSRPAVPADLKRRVLIEAGHRCAIPTCRHPTTEIAHIVPWKDAKEHIFENLIALCPNCHTRYDAGQIDRKSMTTYKSNLAIINSRYGDLERRIFEIFGDNPTTNAIQLPEIYDILLKYALEDGLLQKQQRTGGIFLQGMQFGPVTYNLTDKGRQFVLRYTRGQPLD